MKALLTDVGPLGYAAPVNLLTEMRLVIVDVVEFDRELRLWLQLLTCQFVDHGGPQDIKSLLLPIQAAGGVQVAIIHVNDKNGAGPLARENIPHQSIVVVLVRLELHRRQAGSG